MSGLIAHYSFIHYDFYIEQGVHNIRICVLESWRHRIFEKRIVITGTIFKYAHETFWGSRPVSAEFIDVHVRLAAIRWVLRFCHCDGNWKLKRIEIIFIKGSEWSDRKEKLK